MADTLLPDPGHPLDSEVTAPAAHSDTSASRRIALGDLLSVVLYGLAAVVGYAHVWAHPSDRLVAVGASDPERMVWFVAWMPFAVLHLHDPFFTTWANAPYGVNVLANTSQPLLGLLAAPVTVLWGPVTGFNTLVTLSFVASATAAYVLARRFTVWRPAAFVCGLLYGFSPYMVGQGSVGHLNLLFVPFPPLCFLLLHDLVVRQQGSPLRHGLLLGGLVVAQFFVSSEVLADTAVVAAGGVLLLVVQWPRAVRSHAAYALRGVLAGGLLAGVVLAYPAWVTLGGPQHIVGSIQPHPQQFRADLVAPVVPGQLQRIAPSSALATSSHFESGDLAENGSYLGLPLLLIFVIGVVALRRRRFVLVAGLMALATFVLSLGSHLVVSGTPDINGATGLLLPEVLINHLPLLKNAQPSRYALFTTLFVALVLASVLDATYQGLRRHVCHRTSAMVAGALGLVALLPLLPAWPYAAGATSVPAYFTSGAVRAVPAGSVAMLYPYPGWAVDGSLPMIWQADAGLRFKLAGGYFLVPTPGTHTVAYEAQSLTASVLTDLYAQGVPALTPALRASLRAQLRAWHVTTVLAQPSGVDPAGSLRFLTWLVGRAPTPVDGVEAWYHVSWR